MKTLLALALVLGFSGIVHADDEEKPNCRLRIVTKFKSGKKRVEDKPIHVSSRAECKAEAKNREVVDPESDTEKITVVYKWSGEN